MEKTTNKDKIMIETDRLYVRNFKEEDWRDLQEYVSQEHVLKYESPWDATEVGCRADVEYFSKGNTFLAVELKSSGKMIGHVYFNKAEPSKFMYWDLGYIFNPAYYGNGYATEACRAVIQFGFSELNAHRVCAKCNPDNVASWKLLERLAMRREGHLKQSAAIKKTTDGQPIWWDEYEYAILENEWCK